MKPLLTVTLAIALLASCSHNPYAKFEKALAQQAKDSSHGMIKKVTIDSISVDTFTVAKSMAHFEEIFGFLKDINKEDFIKLRNQEFEIFRDNDTTYFQRIMYGDLKDASEWTYLLRINTEKADSIIKEWDNLGEYNYDVAYLVGWYQDRREGYYSNHSNNWDRSEAVANSKEGFEKYHKYKNAPQDSILNYMVTYTESFFNPIFNTEVKSKRMALFDKDFNILENETIGIDF